MTSCEKSFCSVESELELVWHVAYVLVKYFSNKSTKQTTQRCCFFCFVVNIDNKVGAVGFLPWYMSWLIPYRLIKVDEATGEPIRDKGGNVITCKPDEPGELIGKIQRNHPIRDYLGYEIYYKEHDNVYYITQLRLLGIFSNNVLLVLHE